jgi:NTE family protein
VPGIIAPVELDGRLLGDGGIVDNLPVDAVRAMAADYVIAVNVLGSKPHWTSGPFGLGLAAIEHLIRRAGGGVEKADCLITPAIEHLGYVSLRHRDELIALGRQAAEEKLPEIRAALGL